MNLVELINGLHFKWNLSFIWVMDISFVPFTAAFTINIGLWAIDLHKQVVDKVYIDKPRHGLNSLIKCSCFEYLIGYFFVGH